MREHKPTICVDLDGVIFEYNGWKGPDHFGSLIEDAKLGLKVLKNRDWRIIIFTTRGNLERVEEELDKYNLAYDYINENPDQPDTASNKPIADCYIDDRAVYFDNWSKTLEEVKKFHPYKD